MIFAILIAAYLVIGGMLWLSDSRKFYMDRPAYVSSGSPLLNTFVVVAWPWVLLRRLSYPKPPVPGDRRFDENNPEAWDIYGRLQLRKCNEIHWQNESLFSLQSAGDSRASTERKRSRVEQRLRHHYSEAVKAFEQAVKLDPTSTENAKNLADAKYWLERLHE